MERGARIISLLNSISSYVGSTKTASEAIQTSAASIGTSCNDIETATEATQISSEAVKVACEAIQAQVNAMPLGTFARPYAEITRPANTTQYSAGDVIADNAASSTTHAISGCARVNGGSGQLFGAAIKTDLRTWTQAVTVVIYDAAPASFEADNAAFAGILYSNTDKVVAVLNFPTFVSDSTGAGVCARSAAFCDFPRSFKCESGATKLYFKIFQAGTPTPASGQKFTLIPHILQA